MGPTLEKIVYLGALAGRNAYAVPVTYPGEETCTIAFTGDTMGGDVIMVSDTYPGGIRVTDPGRFGPRLNPAWVRAYFA